MTFKFKCSYQDLCAYRVSASAESTEVEKYRANQHMLDYMRSTFNHPPENSVGGTFHSEIETRQGGVANRTGNYRMSSELYAAFVAFLRENRKKELAEIERYRDHWEVPPDKREPMKPLQIPRPIYYDHGTHQWETEPWYSKAQAAA